MSTMSRKFYDKYYCVFQHFFKKCCKKPIYSPTKSVSMDFNVFYPTIPQSSFHHLSGNNCLVLKFPTLHSFFLMRA